MGFLANHVTHTGSFKYITAIFFALGAEENIARTAEVATTPNLPLTLTAYPTPTPGWGSTNFALK